MSKLDASHFVHLDIPAEVERHTPTKLRPHSRSAKQWVGACPYDDCIIDDDGFIVWPELTDRGRHYYCRGCRRAGNIVNLLMTIKGCTFNEACSLLEIDNPYTQGASIQKAPRLPATARKPLAATGEQVKERDLLQILYPQARRYLAHKRARAYLAARGIPYELAVELGLAYLPPFTDIPGERVTDDLRSLFPWFDRLIFPLTSSAGPGFTGRSLAYWQESIDENEHKQLLETHKIPRYWDTYPTGYFHAGILESSDYATFIEGPFDACALIAGGIVDAVATCGTSLDALVIPLHLKGATLAYDGDTRGKEAAEDVRKLLRREVGILDPRVCTPPDDNKGKDWSERYRLHGIEGLAPLFALDQQRGEASPVDMASAYAATPWYVAGEQDALQIARAALVWAIQSPDKKDFIEGLSGLACSLFEQDAPRAIVWTSELRQAITGHDRASLAALLGEIGLELEDGELEQLLPAPLEQASSSLVESTTEQDQASPSMSLERFTAIAHGLAGVFPDGCKVEIMRAGELPTLKQQVAAEREQREQEDRNRILARRKMKAG